MRPTITPTIKYVGVDMPEIHKFENQYATPHGMAYNSYIVLGDKIALLDTVDVAATDTWMQNLKDCLGECKPDYLIVHHMEPDHSANIYGIAQIYPEMKIVASAKALSMMRQFFEDANLTERLVSVGDGDVIDLGNRQLKVMTAPFVHWPEVVVTYDSLDKVLFSADAFGKFGAEQYEEEWTPEARRYYFNIVGKYGTQVQALLRKAAANEVKVLAPLHGPVLTGDLSPYIDLYKKWSTYTPESQGTLVAYASVYGGTEKAALQMAEALRQKGEEVVVYDLCNDDASEALAQAFRFDKAVLASVTYDANLFPPMYDFIHHLQLKNWQNRRVALIENGTWAPVAGKLMTEMLGTMKGIDIISPTLSIRSTLHHNDLPTLQTIVDKLTNNEN